MINACVTYWFECKEEEKYGNGVNRQTIAAWFELTKALSLYGRFCGILGVSE